jgi:hypothetical protein
MNGWSLAYRTQGGSEYIADLCALTDQCLYHLNGTRNSRVSGHVIRIVFYARLNGDCCYSIEVSYVVYIH